jgi:DNA-binding Lrp family transcriptional regulator
VAVKTGRHDEDWLTTFAAGAKALPEVVEFYRMSGDVDYLLKVVVRDIAAYDRFYKRLIATAPLTDVSFQLRDGADQVHDGPADPDGVIAGTWLRCFTRFAAEGMGRVAERPDDVRMSE